MEGVRGEVATPGKFRRSQNWIGPPGCTLADATYVPPPPEEVPGCLNAWERFLHDSDLPPLVVAALSHYQFEAIHPFLDGNGRIGRLVITLFLVERGILPTPLLYLSAFFEATRRDYYDRLLGVSGRGEWEAWLLYFLAGVARQSEDALDRAERINGLLAEWKTRAAARPSSSTAMVLDLLGENPFLTVTGAAEKLGVAYTTAMRAIRRLERQGILTEMSKAKRNRVWCAREILSVLEEPPRLVPGASR
jgi:Fic family protein